MPSLMRLADGVAALAKRGKAAVTVAAPSATLLPMKCRRLNVHGWGEYCFVPSQCRALGQAAGLTRPRGKPTLAPLWPSRFPAA